jgi:hypothetical protein
MATIRRYANRKLYHVERHRYVNLSDITALVRAGEDVRVLEHPGARDITTEVLAQIIARERWPGLSSLLASLIRWGRQPLGGVGRALLGGLGLPDRGEWQQLEAQVAHLEALVQQLLDERTDRML